MICGKKMHAHMQFIKTQRKIARKARAGNGGSGCFTYAMLDRNIIIKRGISGIRQDEITNKRERSWKREHPVVSDRRKVASRKNLFNCCDTSVK
jgi:hypothetical protein